MSGGVARRREPAPSPRSEGGGDEGGELFRARVAVRLTAGVNDPQGLTVRGSLHELGFAEVREVRIGKLIGIDLRAASAADAAVRVTAMCEQLLVNPVIESYAVEQLDAAPPDARNAP